MTDVSLADRQQAEALLIAFINEHFPDISTRRGTAFRSLIISPAAATYALILKEGQNLRTSLSLSGITESGFDESVIESFIDNFLLSRSPGSTSTGIMRINVSTNKRYTITTDVIFELGTLQFSPQANAIYEVNGEENDNENLFQDPETLLYFFLVPVESLAVTSTVVEAGTLFTLSPGSFIDTDFLTSTSYVDFSQGKAQETITEYRDRALESLTVRDLVTSKSIRTVIPENFGSVLALSIVGMGDVEMLRDLVIPHNIHTGGSVDIFVRTDKIPPIITLEKTVVSNLELELSSPDTPLFKIISVEERVNNNLVLLTEGVDYNISFSSKEAGTVGFAGSPSPTYYSRFSDIEVIKVTFLNSNFINSRVVITAYKPSSILNLQTFVDEDDNRVMASDELVRAMAPVFISSEITYRIESSDKAPDQASLKIAVMDFVNELSGENTIQVSQIIDLIQSFEGVKGVMLPLVINAEVNKTDGSVENISTEDKLVIATEQPIGFSQKICQYIMRAEDLTFNVVIDE